MGTDLTDVQLKKDFTWMIPYLEKISDNGYFYNPRKMLTYRRPFNFIQTGRSIGKSTITACMCILNYIKKQGKFIYIRRTDDETVLGARDFLHDASVLIDEKLGIKNHCYYDGGKFYIDELDEDGEPTKVEIGRAIPLSMVYKRKSMISEGTDMLIFDEFVPQSMRESLGKMDDLTEEYDRICNLYATVDRKRGKAWLNETMLICLGNSSTLFNSMYVGLNALKYIKDDSKIICPKHEIFFIERIDKVEATSDIENSFSFRILTESERNKMFKNDTGELASRYLLKNKPDGSRPYGNFIMKGKKYGVYYSAHSHMVWVGDPAPNEETFSLDIDGHEMSDAELITNWKDFSLMNIVSSAYKKSRCFFRNIKIQNELLTYLRFSV